jgi:hypothetical protein
MYRGLFLAKMKPSASTPSWAAVIASSERVIPQILILTILCSFDGDRIYFNGMFRKKPTWSSRTLAVFAVAAVLYKIARLFMKSAEKQVREPRVKRNRK